MEIKFKNEKELIDGILRTEINVHAFVVLFLDRLGIVPTKMLQNKLIDVQEKRSTDERVFKAWAAKQERVYTIKDIIDAIPYWVSDKSVSVKDAKDQLKDQIGYAKRGTIWYNDFRYYSGEYYFNADGCRTTTYLLYRRGFYDESMLNYIRIALEITEDD